MVPSVTPRGPPRACFVRYRTFVPWSQTAGGPRPLPETRPGSALRGSEQWSHRLLPSPTRPDSAQRTHSEHMGGGLF